MSHYTKTEFSFNMNPISFHEKKLGMVPRACNPSTWEGETGGLLGLRSQEDCWDSEVSLGYTMRTVSRKKTKIYLNANVSK